jgi:hypothetical protein
MGTFTGEQRTLCFEMLGLPQGATLDWYDYNDWTTGAIASQPMTEQVNFRLARDRLNTILTQIEALDTAVDGRFQRVCDITADYKKYVFNRGASIEEGGVAGVAGLRVDIDARLRNSCELLLKQLGIRVAVHNAGQRGVGFGTHNDGGGRNISVGR